MSLSKTYVSFAMIVLTAFSLASCGGGGSSTPSTLSTDTPKLVKIDITGATSLFIATGETSIQSIATAATNSSDKLFKILSGGQILEATITDSDGETSTYNHRITDIYDVNDEYLIVISIVNSSVLPIVGAYLIRKSDGAAFLLGDIPTGQSSSYLNAETVQTDSLGKIYYRVGGVLYQLDTSNPEVVIKTQVTPDFDSTRWYVVSPEGHVCYSYYSQSLEEYAQRIRKTNGELYNLPSGSMFSAWIGLDGHFKYVDSTSGEGRFTEYNGYYDVIIDENYDVTVSNIPNDSSFSVYHSMENSYLLEFQARTIVVKTGSILEIVELENPANIPREINIPEITGSGIAVASNNYYYLSGTDSSNNPILLKIDPNNDNATTLLPYSGTYYDVVKMKVSSNDEVLFYAVRMSDGANVLGKINSSEQLTILDVVRSYDVVQLEQIN